MDWSGELVSTQELFQTELKINKINNNKQHTAISLLPLAISNTLQYHYCH